MNQIDLHTHTCRSDGSKTPTELIDYAIEKGLSVIAITDHDTVDALDEAIEYAKDKPITVIPGVELSTEFQGQDIHVVGLNIDYRADGFKDYLEEFVESRDLRNVKMCRLLTEAGMPMTYEELQEAYPGSVITRAHYARYMLSKGYTSYLKEAFERYIGDNSPYFVPREKITTTQGVELIVKAGGIPVLAHPLLYHMSWDRIQKLTDILKPAGLMAVEAIYTTNTNSDERETREFAAKNGLLISGGSDYHGEAKPRTDLGSGFGGLFVPEDVWDNLRAAQVEKYGRRKILFTDLDGTLLNDASHVSEGTKETLKRMTDAGHKLVLSSGRPLHSVRQVVDSDNLNYKGMYILANNGSTVYDCELDETIMVKTVPYDMVKKIWSMCRERGIHIQTYTDDTILTPFHDKEIDAYMERIHLKLGLTDEPWNVLPHEPYKMLAISLDDKSVLEKLAGDIISEFGDKLTAMFSNDRYLEIINVTSGKGEGLKWLCQKLGIDLSDAYAAGDAMNDLSMIEAAGNGIAMCNGDKALFDSASIISEKTNDDDGLADVIERYIMA